jgi:hypothetical protein
MNYIVDDIGTVVTAVQAELQGTFDATFDETFNSTAGPYYMYGHRMEISDRLLEKDQSKATKYNKYPLIALKLDTPEKVEDGLWHYDLNIAILAFTDRNYDAPDRYTEVFKPVLYPIYESFLKQLRNSGLFMWEGDQQYPPHIKIDRPYWGTEGKEQNMKSFFNDPLDAIEIVNLKISKRIKNC